jgi:hypothetical protein
MNWMILDWRGLDLVYCSKCGFKNEDDVEVCGECGAPLQMSRVERWGRRRAKRTEDECFGLPYGGTIVGLFIGLIIILWGLTQVPGLLPADIGLWPWIVIFFGLLIIAGALYGVTRR